METGGDKLQPGTAEHGRGGMDRTGGQEVQRKEGLFLAFYVTMIERNRNTPRTWDVMQAWAAIIAVFWCPDTKDLTKLSVIFMELVLICAQCQFRIPVVTQFSG